MKFLLIAVNAKYIHSNPAVYSLRAYAGKELEEHIEIAEYTINNRMEDILWDIYRRQPEAVGFSCYIWNWTIIRELLVELPKLLPDTDIWLGGPEVSFDSPKILEDFSSVAGIMTGEGEATFKELLDYYMKKHEKRLPGMPGDIKTLEQIKGLCLATGYTAPRELTDLSSVPFLYQSLDDFANKIIYYESSRGCPYKCSYCLSSIDKRVRIRDKSVVKKELRFFLDHKVPQVKFVDRTFNCNHVHTKEIWQFLIDHDNGVTNFHFEIAGDILQEDEIKLLHKMRPGLVQLEIGVQSVNQKTLEAIHRKMDVGRLKCVVEEIRKGRNVHQHLDLIAGLPFEDYASFSKSFNAVYAMRPDQLQLGFLKVLKGSQMQESAGEFGICYMDKPPYEVLYTRWLSYQEIVKLKRIEEMVELYYNSSQFTHSLPFLEGAFENPFTMYEELAAFYERKGYLTNSPARGYRYEILLEFAGEKDAACLEIYRELLTYDMYLRENLKSRPGFAAELTQWKSDIIQFYKEEERERKYLPEYRGFDYRQMNKMTHLEPFQHPVWDMDWCRKADSRERAEKITGITDTAKMDHEAIDIGITYVETTDIRKKDMGTADVIANETTIDHARYNNNNQKGRKPLGYVLFDYQKRNPLNAEAGTIVLRYDDM